MLRKSVRMLSVMMVVFVIAVVTAYAITWTNLGWIKGSEWYSPDGGLMLAGYNEVGIDRLIYASNSTFSYGSRVNTIYDMWVASGYLSYPALNFDDQRKGGGFHQALDATAWYQTDAPVVGHWRNDDNGDGRKEEVRMSLDPWTLKQNGPNKRYYWHQEFYDRNFPGWRSSGEINDSAYLVYPWGSHIASQWMCKFYYEANNTFSRQCGY